MTLNITQPEAGEADISSDNSDELSADSNNQASADDSNDLFG